MRRILPLAFVLFLGLLFLLPLVAGATPPKLVEPTYDAATKTLSVTISHWSLADGLHYVKYVDVSVNGVLVSTDKYSRQPDTEYTYTFTVEANPGDQIDVKVKCNLWGSRTGSLKVAGPAEAPAPNAQPAQ
jgi:desulfoferrodoxin (superoxide reductase-like protein)